MQSVSWILVAEGDTALVAYMAIAIPISEGRLTAEGDICIPLGWVCACAPSGSCSGSWVSPAKSMRCVNNPTIDACTLGSRSNVPKEFRQSEALLLCGASDRRSSETCAVKKALARIR